MGPVLANPSCISDSDPVIECPVCLTEYINPKSLHCGHSLCAHCVDRLTVEKKINCPICLKATYLPKSGLSTNFGLRDVIETCKRDRNKKRACVQCRKRYPLNQFVLCKGCNVGVVNAFGTLGMAISRFEKQTTPTLMVKLQQKSPKNPRQPSFELSKKTNGEIKSDLQKAHDCSREIQAALRLAIDQDIDVDDRIVECEILVTPPNGGRGRIDFTAPGRVATILNGIPKRIEALKSEQKALKKDVGVVLEAVKNVRDIVYDVWEKAADDDSSEEDGPCCIQATEAMASTAAKPIKSPSSSVDRICECPVCLEIYDDPRLIPCGHSICQKCFKKSVERDGTLVFLKCPICCQKTSFSGRAPSSVSNGRDLPVNFVLKDLISELKRKNDEKHTCQECRSRFSMDQLCNCETCASRLICCVCILKKHKGHDSHLMSDLLNQRQEALDKWRQGFLDEMTKAVDWNFSTIKENLGKELDINNCIDEAFTKLQREWDDATEKLENTRAQDLVITASFDKFTKDTPFVFQAIKRKKDLLVLEIEKFTIASKKMKRVVAEIVPDVKVIQNGCASSSDSPDKTAPSSSPSTSGAGNSGVVPAHSASPGLFEAWIANRSRIPPARRAYILLGSGARLPTWKEDFQ